MRKLPMMVRRRLTSLGSYPAELFSNGEQGAWYDPSDYTTMFQDAAGTTPVTAVEQAVGLILDKRLGLPIGNELVSNNTFATDTIWAKGTGWSIGSGVATKTAGTASVLSQAEALEAGVTYRLVYTITRSAGSITPRFTGGTTVTGTARSAAGTYVDFLTAVSGNTTLEFSADATFAGTVDNVYLKRVSGNDAYQITSASRPTLRARYNLMEYSEQLDNAGWIKTRLNTTGTPAWVNVAVAPDGTTTADKMIEDTNNGTHTLQSSGIFFVSGQKYTISFYAKASERTNIWVRLAARFDAAFPGAYFNLSNGTVYNVDATIESATITDVGNGWYRCTLVDTAIASGTGAPLLIYLVSGGGTSTTFSYAGDGTSGAFIWGAQTIRTNVFPPNTYQRIAAATDYDTGPSFPQFLEFDGTDDSLLTQTVNFTATDKVTVFSGVSKFGATGTTGAIVELGGSVGTGNSFLLAAPVSSAQYYFASMGTLVRTAETTNAVYAAPVSNVFTGIGDISGDIVRIRLNGTVVVTNTQDQGTGNYGNLRLNIGRRDNSGLPFNGRIYSLIVRGAASTADQLSQTERWINNKMSYMVTLA